MSDPVTTERVKVGASALNTLATASMTIGVIAPLAAFLYGFNVPTVPLWRIGSSALIWVLVALGLHFAAQRLLGRLRP